MGSIMPTYIKRAAKGLLEKHAHRFTTDFEHNKRVVAEITDVQSSKVRNVLAGYITRVMRKRVKGRAA
ncbi:MAG: 30S ribosomal protein S17e [Thermoplasmata archaeon]|nr:MAG: 30S ribosomal protein S17e [Thermoplasmata archaeon]